MGVGRDGASTEDGTSSSASGERDGNADSRSRWWVVARTPTPPALADGWAEAGPESAGSCTNRRAAAKIAAVPSNAMMTRHPPIRVRRRTLSRGESTRVAGPDIADSLEGAIEESA